MTGVAAGIRQDMAAVEAALCTEWSAGQTEGNINRLKLLKRQMYGRSGFELLRIRVLHTGRSEDADRKGAIIFGRPPPVAASISGRHVTGDVYYI